MSGFSTMGTTEAEFDWSVVELDEAVAISSTSEMKKKYCKKILHSNDE